MARKCILCGADKELRENIEEFIENGGSYTEAAEIAQKKGLEVSHASLQRHVENHTGINYISPNEADSKTSIEIPQPLKIDSWDQLEGVLNNELREIMGNLCLLCNDRLKAYMHGESRFPKDEFSAMRNTYAMLNKKGDVFEVKDKE